MHFNICSVCSFSAFMGCAGGALSNHVFCLCSMTVETLRLEQIALDMIDTRVQTTPKFLRDT